MSDMTSASLFDSACAARLAALKAENRYRVFARLEKSAARFPVFRADTADGLGPVRLIMRGLARQRREDRVREWLFRPSPSGPHPSSATGSGPV